MDLVKCPKCGFLNPITNMRCIGCGLPMCILLNIVDTGPESLKSESYISMDDDEYATLQDSIIKKQESDNTNNIDTKIKPRRSSHNVIEDKEKTEEEKIFERAIKRIRGARRSPIQITTEEMAKYTEFGLIRWYFLPTFSVYSPQQNRFQLVFFAYNINSAYVLDGTIKENVIRVTERLFVIKKERSITTRFILRQAIENKNQDYTLKKLVIQAGREKKGMILDILEYWDDLNKAAKKEEDHYFRKRNNDRQISGLAASLGLKSHSSIAEPVGQILSRSGKLRK